MKAVRTSTGRLRVVGHKLTTEWSGVESSYARGRCECGWNYKGWTERMGSVRHSHQSHLRAVVEAASPYAHITAWNKAMEPERHARALRVAASARGNAERHS